MSEFSKEIQRYTDRLHQRYNFVQVLGMREPVPLKSLFVRANILEKITARTGLMRPEDLHDFFDFDRRAFGTTRETVDGEIIVNKLQKFIVLGKPGAGKTTYLKYLTLMMLDQFSRIERRKLPVFITLREWADTGKPLMDFIVDQFDICGFEQAGAFVEQMLRNGQCLVLFDGLDEVSEAMKQDDVIRQIKDFADKYYENQFVVSCRVAAYNHWLTGFTEVEMADFNEAQMEAFIKNWFHGDPKTAAECWRRLKASAPLKELASVPLLLTLLCLEYGESNDFPPNRAELYQSAISTLLTKWDGTRKIRRPEVYKKLSTRQKESMFARIAIGTFLENQYFISERDLTRMIGKFIEHLPGAKEEETEPDSLAILKGIEAQHGIFVERAKGVYSFAHLTFQEYFTAKYIVDNSREGMLEQLIERHLYDPKWAEVFKLVAGLLDSADEFLFRMNWKAKEALEYAEFNALMKTAEQSLMLRGYQHPEVILRVLAAGIIIACNPTLGYEFMISLDILILILQVGLKFKKDIHFNHGYPYALVWVSAPDHMTEYRMVLLMTDDFDIKLSELEDLKDEILNNINLEHLMNYSKKAKFNQGFFSKIKNYFSANLLILDCLSAANYVSKPVREKMIHEICLPKRG